MKKMFGRQLRQATSPHLIEGVAFRNGERWINVQYLWEDSGKDEDEFIRRFSKAYLHETMHLCLLHVPDKFIKGEEKILRKYVDEEEWTDNLEEFYRNDTTKSLPKRTKRRARSKSRKH